MNEINILGTKYSLIYKNVGEDEKLGDVEGYTDLYEKEIVICNLETKSYFENVSKEKIKKVMNKILRHEIIHAFLYESGLDCNSNRIYNWAENEEMVDWIAIQSPKIYKVFKELKLLGEI